MCASKPLFLPGPVALSCSCRHALLALAVLTVAPDYSCGQAVLASQSNAHQPIAQSGHGAVATRPAASARDPARIVRVAVVQAGTNHYAKGNPGPEANFQVLAGEARKAAAARPRPDVIVFPEFAISGWPYPSEERINPLAEPVPGDGPWYRRYRALARETGTAVLAWLLDLDGDRRYNTACLIDGQGQFRGKYHKVQTTLGEQGWWGWSKGKRFEVMELDGVRYGISICADMWFPETVRCLELMGADVVLHQSIGDDMERVVPTRAMDSLVPIALAIFQGGSYAVDAEGNVLGKLPSDTPGWKAFDFQPFRRSLGTKYGGRHDERQIRHNVRNPRAYSILADPSTRPPWTEVYLDSQGRRQTREQILRQFHGHYDADDPDSPAPAATAPAQ
ncbi:MAG TPA: carbon-nitrogen hydrolase family protein [Phycisphaerae bacterium]|nr:carbon-nitrogen hydrolase family protein [Phycisphaerae bacterium]